MQSLLKTRTEETNSLGKTQNQTRTAKRKNRIETRPSYGVTGQCSLSNQQRTKNHWPPTEKKKLRTIAQTAVISGDSATAKVKTVRCPRCHRMPLKESHYQHRKWSGTFIDSMGHMWNCPVCRKTPATYLREVAIPKRLRMKKVSA
jgi:hypothetical protein